MSGRLGRMTRPIATCKPFDVVVVPFPFTDSGKSRRRPAVVLSSHAVFNRPAGHSVMAMVTSAGHHAWPLDVPVRDLAAAGLPAASVVRMKLFTLDHQFVLGKAGALSRRDRTALRHALRRLLSCIDGGS